MRPEIVSKVVSEVVSEGGYWFVHQQNKKFTFRTNQYNEDKKKNPDLPVELIKEITKFVTIPKNSGELFVSNNASVTICDKLWKDCDLKQRKALTKELPDGAFEKCRAEFNQLRFQVRRESEKAELDASLAGSRENIQRIICVHPEDAQNDEEVWEGLLVYTAKHSGECCIVNSEVELNELLRSLQGRENLTLVIMSDNHRKDERFLWGSIHTAGNDLGQIVANHRSIGHVRIISCEAGPPDISYGKTHQVSHAKKSGTPSGRLLYVEREDGQLPYKSDSLAACIWRKIKCENPDREISLSASPWYLHIQNHQFVGSEYGAPKISSGHGFFSPKAKASPEAGCQKSITFTTPHGTKANKL